MVKGRLCFYKEIVNIENNDMNFKDMHIFTENELYHFKNNYSIGIECIREDIDFLEILV